MNDRPNYRQKQRIKRRTRKRKKSRLFRVLWRFFLLFLFIYLLLYGLGHSGIFTIKSVTVTGNEKVSAEAVINQAKLQQGNNYFEISTAKRERLLDQIAYVKNAKIKYHLGGRVTVQLVERKPIFQLYTTQYYLVDNEFRILEQNKDKMENILNIEGVDVETKVPGDYILTGQECQMKRELLTKIMSGDNPMAENFRSIELLDSVATFITLDGIRVEFGSYNNIDYKLKMLTLILKDIQDTGKNASAILLEKGPNPIVVEEGTTTDKSKKERDLEKERDPNKKDQAGDEKTQTNQADRKPSSPEKEASRSKDAKSQQTSSDGKKEKEDTSKKTGKNALKKDGKDKKSSQNSKREN